MRVSINQQSVDLPEGKTVLQAIREAGAALPEPESLGETRAHVRNALCPLLGLARVNGLLVPLSGLASRPLMENMVIETNAPEIREALEARARLLAEQGECHYIRSWQKVLVAEGENAGFLTMDAWEKFAFAERRTLPSIVHDPNRCIRCGACVETCRAVQGVEALKMYDTLGVQVDDELCVRCGQCILSCPTGAIAKFQEVHALLQCGPCPYAKPVGAMREQDDTRTLQALLRDPGLYPVVQFAPSVRASLGEEFGLPDGELVTSKLYAALRRLGFKKVWDTNFSADLTIMEEGSELVERLTHHGCLPMFTSCSPGWVNFIETSYPDLLPNVSTAKSPQQMFGALAKTLGAETLGIAPENMRVVSIMPCTAKKAEAARPEMNAAERHWQEAGRLSGEIHFPDVDVVLTTREIARLLKMAGLDLASLPDEAADPLLGEYSGAAPIFGRTGGVMEAALRTGIWLLTKKRPASLEFEELGTLDGIKRAQLRLGRKVLRVAVAHGLANARTVCESVLAGGEFANYHFIEIMACPGGCIGGGGQPIPTHRAARRARTQGLNRDDREQCEVRMSHENPEVQEVYRRFLKKPSSPLAHHLLHTQYTRRRKAVGANGKS